jgi:hypothetical protein
VWLPSVGTSILLYKEPLPARYIESAALPAEERSVSASARGATVSTQLDTCHSQWGIQDGTQIKAVAISRISDSKYDAAIDESDERNFIAELLMDVDD